MTRLAIISALHEELAETLALMPDAQRHGLAGRTFWQGHLAGHAVVGVLSGMGKVAAATTATLLLQRWQPQALLFTGVAGGLAAQARVGDVVVGSACLQHDMDASPLCPRHELPGYGRSWLAADLALCDAAADASRSALHDLPAWLDAGDRQRFGLLQPQVHVGQIVTGDRFVSTARESDALRQALPAALAVDMESAAVAQVCHDHGTPFVAVRTISDRADDAAHIDFPAFLHGVARHYSRQVVQGLLQRL
jgi:adenosylhomocysteine nucleosidase